VSRTQAVEVAAYDVTGRRVAVLLARAVAAGEAVALGLDASALPAGVYVVRARGEDFTAARRVTVVRGRRQRSSARRASRLAASSKRARTGTTKPSTAALTTSPDADFMRSA